ncbi:MAG: TetR/AcrR family transcriptional regulator [Chloroflexota bacterium]|nr:MAG: TetR/AcrR family transcriptional regulator [Chloroflexota bacterium]
MFPEWTTLHTYILELEQKGLVTRTFRRLDPDRQQAVVAAILDEAVAKGPNALNIKEVAGRAGVSVGSLYQYFGSRDGLIGFAVELCVRTMTGLIDSMGPYIPAMSFRDALEAYMSVGIEYSQPQAGLIQFFGRAAYTGDPDLAEQVVRPIAVAAFSIIQALFAQAAERGEIRQDVDIEATERVVHALTIAVADSQLLPYLNTYFQVTGGDVTPERAIKATVDLVLYGVSPRPDGAGPGQGE